MHQINPLAAEQTAEPYNEPHFFERIHSSAIHGCRTPLIPKRLELRSERPRRRNHQYLMPGRVQSRCQCPTKIEKVGIRRCEEDDFHGIKIKEQGSRKKENHVQSCLGVEICVIGGLFPGLACELSTLCDQGGEHSGKLLTLLDRLIGELHRDVADFFSDV